MDTGKSGIEILSCYHRSQVNYSGGPRGDGQKGNTKVNSMGLGYYMGEVAEDGTIF
jgi:hypothetical protein